MEGPTLQSAASVPVGWRRSASLVRAGKGAWTLGRARGDDERELLARRALADSLSCLRGIPMKIGQLLSRAGDDDPLQELVTGIPALPCSALESVLEKELGARRGLLLEWNEALHAASLGQVHPAMHADGRRLVVKIQYPGIDRAVDTEIQLLSKLGKIGPMARQGFDLEAYQRVLRDNFERELDYRIEASTQERFRECTPVAGLKIARVVRELSTRRILSQERLDGAPLSEVLHWDKRTRLRIAQVLLSTLVHGLFVSGMLHGDPHAGNFAFTQRGEVLLFDFGCVLEVDTRRRRALLSLITRLRSGHVDGADVIDQWVTLGFDRSRLEFIGDAVEELSRLVFAPFLQTESFDLNTWRLSERVSTLLGERKWAFRAAGPADLFLLLRAVQGTCSLLKSLDVRLPWWAIVEHLVPAEERTRATAEGRSEHRPAASTVDAHAPTQLHIEVTDRPEPLRVALPAEDAFELTALLPSGLLEGDEIKRLRQVEQELRAAGLQKGPLLSGESSQGSYRIWLD